MAYADKENFREICEFCGMVLKSRFDYEAHITGQTHSWNVKQQILREQHWERVGSFPSSVTYSCVLCHCSFIGAKNYYKHILTKHRKNRSFANSPYQHQDRSMKVCRLCNIELHGRRAYYEHMRSDYHECALKHRELMRKGFEYARPIPGKSSSKNAQTSSGHSGYQCHFCDAVHRSQDLLDSHILSEHPKAKGKNS